MAEWRSMTPQDWAMFVEAWNDAHAGEAVEAPTFEQFQELKAKYGN